LFKKLFSYGWLLILFCTLSYPAGLTTIFAQAASADQIIALKSGFNFVSFTVAPPAAAQTLKDNNADIEDIYLYSAAAGSFLSVSDGTLTSLSSGRGYIIKARAETSVTITGSPASTIGDINLKTGFNLIGFSKSPSAAVTFSQLMKNNSLITGIYKWSPSAGSFIQVISDLNGNPFQLDGSDPQIKPGESYFIKTSGDTAINYDDGITSPKVLASLELSPTSASAAPGAAFDMSGIKAFAVYSDKTTEEVTLKVSFTAESGIINGMVFTAPNLGVTAMIKAAYTPAGGAVSKETYFTLFLAAPGSGSISTVTSQYYKCSYKLASNAKIIDEETIITRSVTTDQVVLSGSLASSIASGDILVGYYGDGYLRKAGSIVKQSDEVYIYTSQSRLDKVFEELDYNYRGKLSTLAASNSVPPGSSEFAAVSRFLRSTVVFAPAAPDRSIVSADKLKKILDNLSLSVTLAKADIAFDPVIECDIHIGTGSLKRFLFMIGGDISAGLAFDVEATAVVNLPVGAELTIYQSVPYVFSVGPVPFSFDWDIKCGVEASASAAGTFSYAGNINYNVRVGAEYDGNSWKKINDISKTVTASDSYELNGTVLIKPYLNTEFFLKITGIAGPEVSIETFIEFIARLNSEMKTDISVTAGVEAGVSFVLEMLSLEIARYDASLFSFNWDIYKKTVDNYVAPPEFATYPGGYEDGFGVAIVPSGTESVTIKYTTNGQEPKYDTAVTYSGPISLVSSTAGQTITIKAAAFETNSEGKIISSQIISGNFFVVAKGDPDYVQIFCQHRSSSLKLYPRTGEYYDGVAYDDFQAKFPEYIYFKKGTTAKFTITNSGTGVIDGYSVVRGYTGGNPFQTTRSTYSGEERATAKTRFFEWYISDNDPNLSSIQVTWIILDK